MKYVMLIAIFLVSGLANAEDGSPMHLLGIHYGSGKLSGSSKDATVLGVRFQLKQTFLDYMGFGAFYESISADQSSSRIGIMAVFFPYLDSHVGFGPAIRMGPNENKNSIYFEAGYSFRSGLLSLTPLISFDSFGADTLSTFGARLAMGI